MIFESFCPVYVIAGQTHYEIIFPSTSKAKEKNKSFVCSKSKMISKKKNPVKKGCNHTLRLFYIWDALRDLVPFVQFERREKH